jgi:hypothetical protein
LRHMRLPDTLKKIKHYPDLPKDVFVLLVLILATFGAFLLGRYSVAEEKRGGDLRIIEASIPQDASRSNVEATPRIIPTPPSNTPPSPDGAPANAAGMYVGSKSGKSYYLPWCAGVKRIKDANKVWFADKADAESRGYRPSSTCKGM